MKSDRVNYVVVGAFVLAMLGGVIVSIALLTGRTGGTDAYYTSYTDATGLKFGSQVLYMGYPVGQVEEIKPVLEETPVRFRVKMAINKEVKDWRVPKDSVAQIKAAGLLAAVIIDIRAGESSEALMPGDEIEGREQADVVAAVSEAANTLKVLTDTSIKPLIENLHRYVTNFGSTLDERGGDLISDLAVLAKELSVRSPELISKFIAVSEEIKQTSTQLRVILSDDNAQKIGSAVDNLLMASENVAELSKEAKQQIHSLLGPESSKKVDRALINISDASTNIARLSKDVNQNLKSVLTPETAAKIQRALENFSAAAANIAQLTEDLGQTRTELDKLLASLSGTVDDNRPSVRRSTENLQYTLRSVARHIDAVTYNLESTSRNLAEFSRQVRMNPSLLLRPGTPEDNTATQTGITP